MNGFLLDTNVLSELVRPKPEPKVENWLSATDEQLLHISVLTLGEIRKGIATLAQNKRRSELESWLEVGLKARFAERLLMIDAETADRWGFLAARARSQGVALAVIDGLLAATAQQHNLTIVTRNTADFAVGEAQLLNPWE
ncbi:MAG TPA: type II toxin-antitoxin system VapC family toxin [Candidatus Obscuribacterales bacterium]